jgi:hypothetical protein
MPQDFFARLLHQGQAKGNSDVSCGLRADFDAASDGLAKPDQTRPSVSESIHSVTTGLTLICESSEMSCWLEANFDVAEDDGAKLD